MAGRSRGRDSAVPAYCRERGPVVDSISGLPTSCRAERVLWRGTLLRQYPVVTCIAEGERRRIARDLLDEPHVAGRRISVRQLSGTQYRVNVRHRHRGLLGEGGVRPRHTTGVIKRFGRPRETALAVPDADHSSVDGGDSDRRPDVVGAVCGVGQYLRGDEQSSCVYCSHWCSGTAPSDRGLRSRRLSGSVSTDE